MEAIIVALITGGVTVLGVVIANGKQSAVMGEKIEALSERVEKHNNVIERVYKLEEQPRACAEKFKTLFSDIERLER
ncbi:hypothetical protein [Eggerthella guodeyinii]|uniref:Uncharacterized protein n=1 Tax=Eggerthella guodeyinii TaxID=2690837 RepID=A0A6N7RLY4_9ACTN|nr:hypothetical protein [Eggerthella guodeyinii]MRX82266.1 hypothetical protein [Eggerthella guodeyinii]